MDPNFLRTTYNGIVLFWSILMAETRGFEEHLLVTEYHRFIENTHSFLDTNPVALSADT